MKVAVLLLLLFSGLLAPNIGPRNVSATHDPKNFTIMARFSGWNSTLPPGSFAFCSPTATTGCNPNMREFRGVIFTVTVQWRDIQHNFAIYTKGTIPSAVNTLQTCSPPGTNGCWARSATVTSTSPTARMSFTPTVPADDFAGPGGYEYYCQFHPDSMHGKMEVVKSPDLNSDGNVDIVDVATVALAFGASPTSGNWNLAADLDNNGRVDIVDVATAALYFGKTL